MSYSKQSSLFLTKGLFFALITFTLAFSLRMLEWPSWQDAEFRLGEEMLLATHDAYHWVAGAENFGLAKGHPMARMLEYLGDFFALPKANIAFWFPAVLSSLVAVLIFVWVWALGSMEAGIAAGLVTSFSPGFLARTLLGFYDTDLITLFFPLLITLVPATWTMRFMLLPQTVVKKLMQFGKQNTVADANTHGNPLAPLWIILLGLSGLLSFWTQEWHSVFPYLIRYNIVLLACMALCMAPRKKRGLILLGALSYTMPAMFGLYASILPLIILITNIRQGRPILKFCTHPAILLILWGSVCFAALEGNIATTILNHINAYLKHAGDVKTQASGLSLVYPSVAQSIVEVQDVSAASILSYFHPWPEAAFLGLAGFLVVLIRRPGALFLLPLAALAILSTRLGGRMVMFGAPIIGIGISLPLYWLCKRLFATRLSSSYTGLFSSCLVCAILIVPFVDIITAMSQGPMINRRHADCLTRAHIMTPKDAFLWLWWDWGYAAHHFAKRKTIADGAEHAGPSLYLPAAVFATDNPRFARQLMRYTEQKGNIAGNVFESLDGKKAQDLMTHLASPQTPLLERKGHLYIIVSFEMLRLGFWISNFGSWNFETRQGEGGALSIIPQELAFRLDTGEVRLSDSEKSIDAASISIFEETGITHKDYLEEWINTHPNASEKEKKTFLATRRNVHFLFNKVTEEKLAIDERLYHSLMVRLLIAKSGDPLLTPYFKLIYDNVFARIYEVL